MTPIECELLFKKIEEYKISTELYIRNIKRLVDKVNDGYRKNDQEVEEMEQDPEPEREQEEEREPEPVQEPVQEQEPEQEQEPVQEPVQEPEQEQEPEKEDNLESPESDMELYLFLAEALDLM